MRYAIVVFIQEMPAFACYVETLAHALILKGLLEQVPQPIRLELRDGKTGQRIAP